MAQAAMAGRDTSVSELCKELGVTPVTLYRYVDPNGNLRDHGKRVLSAWRRNLHSPASDPTGTIHAPEWEGRPKPVLSLRSGIKFKQCCRRCSTLH